MMNSYTAIRIEALIAELGPSPVENIDHIVDMAADLLACPCSLFAAPAADGRRFDIISARNLPSGLAGSDISMAALYKAAVAEGSKQTASIDEPRHGIVDDQSGWLSQLGFGSFIGYPVYADGCRPGVLAALDHKSRVFTTEDRLIFALMAKTLAVEELRRCREQDLKRRIGLEQVLKDVSTLAIADGDVPSFLNRCLELAAKALGVGGAYVWECNPKKKTVGAVAEWVESGGPPQKDDLQGIPVETVPWDIGRLMNGQILKVEDVDAVSEGRERDIFQALDIRAALALPLFSKDRFIGFVEFEDYQRPRRWAPEEIVVLQTAAEIAMRGIENHRLGAKLAKRRWELDTKVSERIRSIPASNERIAKETEAHRQTIDSLQRRDEELREKTDDFEKLNTTLAVLLKKRDGDVKDLERRVVRNIRDLIKPALEKLKSTSLSESQVKWLGVLEANVNWLSSPSAGGLSAGYHRLTPTEIKIVSFIRHNRTSKEIAELLGVSIRTVEVHRNNIRKKFGIKNRKSNLKTFLLSMG